MRVRYNPLICFFGDWPRFILASLRTGVSGSSSMASKIEEHQGIPPLPPLGGDQKRSGGATLDGGQGGQTAAKRPCLVTPSSISTVRVWDPTQGSRQKPFFKIIELAEVSIEDCKPYEGKLQAGHGLWFFKDVVFKTLKALDRGTPGFHTTSDLLGFLGGPLRFLYPFDPSDALGKEGAHRNLAKKMRRWALKCATTTRAMGVPYLDCETGGPRKESTFRMLFQTEEGDMFAKSCTPRDVVDQPTVEGLMVRIVSDRGKRNFVEARSEIIYPDDTESTFSVFFHVGAAGSGKTTQGGHIDKISAECELRVRPNVGFFPKAHRKFTIDGFIPSVSHTFEEAESCAVEGGTLEGLQNKRLSGTDNDCQRLYASGDDISVRNAKWHSHGWKAFTRLLERWRSKCTAPESEVNLGLLTVTLEEPFITDCFKKTIVLPAHIDDKTGFTVDERREEEDVSYGMLKEPLLEICTQGANRGGLGGLYLTLHSLPEVWNALDTTRQNLKAVNARLILVSLSDNNPNFGELLGQPFIDEMEQCCEGSMAKLEWFVRDYGHAKAMLWIHVPVEDQLIPSEVDQPWDNFGLFTKDSCADYLAGYKEFLKGEDTLSLAKLYHSKCHGSVGIFKPSD